MNSSTRVMKAHVARDLGTPLAFNFEDLKQQATAQLLAAQQQAQSIRAEAEAQKEALFQRTQAEAREAGRREGLRDAQQQIDQQASKLAEQRVAERLKTVLPALTQAAAQLQTERDRWLLRWEKTAVDLGIAIAEKLIRANLEVRPELATGMIAEALHLAAGAPQLRLQLHPADLERLGSEATTVVQSLAACAEAVLVPDAALQPGECVVETRHGEIDARLETMLVRIAEELLAS